MPDLPTGTVTFLFSDIEGSTQLLQRLGDAYPEVLADHQRLLRAAWAEHAGVEIDTQGDSFFVVFARATDALAAAAQAQRALAGHAWPAGGQVRVRMGLHTGVGTLSHGHYVGLDVHRAARIAAAGHGGQVLLSQATRDQVARELVAGAGLRDLGRHRLKDLPRREEIYQLVLPGMPAEYPPLKTLDAWPGYRADLVAVVLLGAVLLAAVGLALPLAAPSFPRAIGLGAAGLAALLLVSSAAARPVRRALAGQWRDARKPVAATTSALLSAVVVATTLFVTKPPIFVRAAPPLYDFSYHPTAPGRHTGGTVTIGVPFPYESNAQINVTGSLLQPYEAFLALSQTCLTQIPDVSQGLDSFKPDQCTEVPTIANGLESPDYKTTTFRIDPRAVWSDGYPVTAADYVFANLIFMDPNVGGGVPPSHFRSYTALDARTVRIDWAQPVGFYTGILANDYPLPLHAIATGAFAGIYNPRTGVYNSALAQKLFNSASYLAATPVVDGPFMVRSFVPGQRADLVRNPRYVSNFFHSPALDGLTFVTDEPDPAHQPPGSQLADTLVGEYRQGTLDEVQDLSPLDLGRLRGIPQAQVVTSPVINILDINFSQRAQAPSTQANGGVKIFADLAVRKAFVEAFDRCAAVRAQLGSANCKDHNLFTDELSTYNALDYDSTVALPTYNPTDAARLMDQAGYPLVDGFRRYKDGRTPIELTVAVSGGASSATIIEQRMQQDYLRNLGIGVVFASPAQFGDLITKGTFDIALWVDTGSIDPVLNAIAILGFTDAADIPPGGINYLGIIDPYIVKQIDLAGTQQDPKQAAEIGKQRLRYVAQQLYVDPVVIIGDVALVRPTLCNFKKFPEFGYNTWNIADWYVAPSCPT
jgi:ABC-type transport system substrate-binding protein/class 3 adenylate cyclase